MKTIVETIALVLGYVTIGLLVGFVFRILVDGIARLIDSWHGYDKGLRAGYKAAVSDFTEGKNPDWRYSVCADCEYFLRVPVTFGGVPDPDVTHPRCNLGIATFLDLEDVTRHHACPEWQPREKETTRDKSHETAPICQ